MFVLLRAGCSAADPKSDDDGSSAGGETGAAGSDGGVGPAEGGSAGQSTGGSAAQGTGGSAAQGTGGSAGAGCPAGQVECGSGCVDLQSDPSNCGTCNNACDASQVCSAGQCTNECAAGETQCGQSCVDTSSNLAHCGGCDRACDPVGEECVGGGCRCLQGRTRCSGICVDLSSDPAHCGDCGTACSAGDVCLAGSCAPDCGAGLTLCGLECVDTLTSVTHCGNCSNGCRPTEVCASGSCTCPTPATWCSIECIDTSSSNEHCGQCNSPCTNGFVCENSACICPSDRQVCGTDCVDLLTHNDHCGGCNSPCTNGYVCESGQCICPAGHMVCGDWCRDVLNDPWNCGTCGTLCSLGLGLCCDGACIPGYDTNQNCGECGRVCTPPSHCEFGNCVCPAGQGYCDESCRNISDDPNNCGGCGRICGSGAHCEGGVCVCADETQAYCGGECRSRGECILARSQYGWTDQERAAICASSGDNRLMGTATWYTLTEPLPHCSYPPETLPQYYAAINQFDYKMGAACGACVRIYGPAPELKTLDVQIVDECPYLGNEQWCWEGSHHIDLNETAFAYFADPIVGVLRGVRWEWVECNVQNDYQGNLAYAYKDGTVSNWGAIMIRNHPLPLAVVELAQAGGAFFPLTPTDYNYWLDPLGFGQGPYTLRITDIAGNVVEQPNIPAPTLPVTQVTFQAMSVQSPGCP